MRRAVEFVAFAGVAALLHAGLFLAWTPAGATSGGSGEEALVTLASASPQMREMVAQWDRPPETHAPAEAAPRPEAPSAELPALPTVAGGVAVPASPQEMARPEARREAVVVATEDPPRPPEPEAQPEPQPEAPPPPPRKPEPPKRQPEPKPQPKREPRPEPAVGQRPQATEDGRGDAASAGQVAAGTGGSSDAGTAARAGASSAADAARRVDLMQLWGADIRRDVERAKRALRLRRAQGETVVVALTVGPDGALLGSRVARSSGEREFDEAALEAVSRAAPFPEAPPELGGRPQTFTLPMQLR